MELEIQNKIRDHHQAGFGWALACCSYNSADAEDVLQTVYLKILDGRAKFNGRSEFKTWFFALIRNTAVDIQRRRLTHYLKFDKLRGFIVSENERLSTDEKLESDEMDLIFRRILSRLPRRQSEVLHLVFYQDLTLEQAADVMQISLGSVRQHYDRGKKRFRKFVEDAGGLHELF